MAVSGQVILKVTPEQLLTKAQTTRNNISNLTAGFERIGSVVEQTKNYWIGDAGDLYRRIYIEESGQIQEMLARLLEHPSDLEKIAKNYMDVEDTVEEIALELPGDIIS
ncbi:MAG: WXG100 family type VII secretion target [Lachnospiraceae bacterium]|nr:WXG100 family type VII secretion target [Lachnospiraceae bacterium]